MPKNTFIIEGVSSSPVSVAALRQHLHLWDDGSYDSELKSLLLTATEHVGNHIGCPVSAVTYETYFNSFVDIELEHSNPLNLAVQYYDELGAVQTLSSGNYIVDNTGVTARIIIQTLPVTSTKLKNPIFVRYTVDPDSLPNSIRHAILMTAAELFEVRTESTDAKMRQASLTVNRLLMKDKRVVV